MVYDALLDGASCGDALRRAQLAMKQRHSDPFYWAGLVCHGDPRTLVAK
jgi:CHAT domain-containing protein